MNKLEFFKSLDFTDYESKTLTTLTKLSTATAKQISEDSGVPQNKLYQIIKKFQQLGILAQVPADSKKYKLINLKTFISNKLKKKQSQLKQLKESSKNIETINEPESEFSFSLIKGQRAIMNKLAEHNSIVQKEILGVQRNWKVWGTGLREMQKATKRGINVKLIGVINEQTKKRANEWKSTGCKLKKYNKKFGENPLRFSIFDNKEARITFGKPEISSSKDYITIWTKSKPLIAILKKQFNEMWKECESF